MRKNKTNSAEKRVSRKKAVIILCAVLFFAVIAVFTWFPEQMQKLFLTEVEVDFIRFSALKEEGEYYEHVVSKDALLEKNIEGTARLYLIGLQAYEESDYENLYKTSFVEVSIIAESEEAVAVDGDFDDVFLIVRNPTEKIKDGDIVLGD